MMEPEKLNWKTLRSPGEFWETGNALCDASEVMQRSRSYAKKVKLGGIRRPENEGAVWRRGLISNMLFAFAVEAWCKGLVFASPDQELRSAILKELRDPHDLQKILFLARVDFAGQKQEKYLRALMEVAQLGRYPEFMKDREMENLRTALVHPKLKSELTQAIQLRWIELTPMAP